MKRLIEDDGKNPMVEMIGQRLTFFCANYIYTGILAGVNENCVLLTSAAIVYETGPFGEKQWKDAQNLPEEWYVQIDAIESFGKLK